RNGEARRAAREDLNVEAAVKYVSVRSALLAFWTILILSAASSTFACRPSFPITPRATSFIGLLENATSVVEGRVLKLREIKHVAIFYADIEVRTVLAGPPIQGKVRVWSHRGIRTTCDDHNYLATLKGGDSGVFAVRTIPIDQRITVQVEHDIRTIIVAH